MASSVGLKRFLEILGEEIASSRISNHSRSRLIALVRRRYYLSYDEALEVVIDAFNSTIIEWDSWGNFSGLSSQEFGYRCLNSVYSDARRRARVNSREVTGEEDVPEKAASDDAFKDVLCLDIIDKIKEAVTPSEFEILVLLGSGASYSELAEKLQIKESLFRVRVSRMRQRLTTRFEEELRSLAEY